LAFLKARCTVLSSRRPITTPSFQHCPALQAQRLSPLFLSSTSSCLAAIVRLPVSYRLVILCKCLVAPLEYRLERHHLIIRRWKILAICVPSTPIAQLLPALLLRYLGSPNCLFSQRRFVTSITDWCISSLTLTTETHGHRPHHPFPYSQEARSIPHGKKQPTLGKFVLPPFEHHSAQAGNTPFCPLLPTQTEFRPIPRAKTDAQLLPR
jgi:hypothetical protein